MQKDIETLRSRLDILDIAREYVRELRRSGNSWAALCPFHDEKTPSFRLDHQRGLYYCFGCHKGGDAIGFYMEIENMDFKQAVESLCERVGLPRPSWSSKGGSSEGESKARAEIQKALHLASTLYAEALLMREDPPSERARSYCLNARQLERKIIQGYHIGFAPQGANWLTTTLVTKHGIEPGILAKAGLVAVSSKDGRYIDFFRGRIVFPVIDLQGKVCGFGGRILPQEIVPAMGQGASLRPGPSFGNEGPKYLNSPDTAFFKKGETLYGLAQHKSYIREANKAYIVEGYFDVAGLAQAGITLAVSPMGGALTLAHAKILARFAKTIVLVFDPDAAGISSAIRAGRILLSQGLEVRVMHLPSGLDPDEFAHAHGRQAFFDLEAKGSKALVDFELESYLAGRSLAVFSVSERLALAKRLLPTMAVMSGEIEAREAVTRVAQALRLDLVGLERELWRFSSDSSSRGSAYGAQGATSSARGGRAKPAGAPADSFAQSGARALSLEESLLGMAAVNPDAVRRVLQSHGVGKEDFVEQRIAGYLFDGAMVSPEMGLPDDWGKIFSRAVLGHSQELASGEFEELLGGYAGEMRQRSLVRELRELREIIRMRRKNNQPCEEALLMKFQEISKRLKGSRP